MKVMFDTPEEARKRFAEIYKNHECEVQHRPNDLLVGIFSIQIIIKISGELDEVLNLSYCCNDCYIDVYFCGCYIQFPETLDKIRELFNEVAENDNPL